MATRGREQVLLGTAKSGFQMGSQGPFTYYTIPKGSPKLFLCSSSSTIGRDTYYLKVKLLTNNSYYGVLLDYMARDVLKGKKWACKILSSIEMLGGFCRFEKYMSDFFSIQTSSTMAIH